jgi:hypothetical protein
MVLTTSGLASPPEKTPPPKLLPVLSVGLLGLGHPAARFWTMVELTMRAGAVLELWI